jgi:hypothetical protein
MKQSFLNVFFAAINQPAMRLLFLTLLLTACIQVTFAQTTTRVSATAVRTTAVIKVDGDMSDPAWQTATRISGLTEMRPTFNKAEEAANKTELYILYDDNAIYVGGILNESSRDNISTELAGRDNIGANDFAGVIFDTYQDRINGLGFYVTPLGEQFDIKYSIGGDGGEDMSWNTVYQSEAKILANGNGWSFEMRIPYSAIRFSKEKIQNWGMQFIRRRNKTGQQLSWSPVDPNKFGFMNQAGDLTNITDIKPPLRLSFSPYFSSYLTHNPKAPGTKWNTSVNGGMDVKYGITDGFTMDMTLVPDFGQVQSDNQVLNLSPFEVRYNEYRTFFNEGTELFNKGNLFYSRRIGGQPIHYYDVYGKIGSTETVIKNPGETKLINATKISGRTKKKLGIGFFNAITKPQYATVETDAKEEYEVQTNPLTNYNVLVLDQAMKNNSAVTLVNTNVWRSGADYDANVTAVLWDLYDKNVDWNVWGQVTTSRLTGYEAPDKTTSGYHYNLFGGKFKGRFNFDVHRLFADKNYNQRDMGFFNNNNYLDHGFWAGYKWVKPKGIYNNIRINLNGTYSELNKPRKFQYFRINGNVNGQLKNLWFVGMNIDWKPESQDFYEPRIEGKMVKLPGSWMKGFWMNTNQAKKYTFSYEIYNRRAPKYKARATDMYVGNNYRFNDKLSIGLSSYMEFYNRTLGFAMIPQGTDSVIMGLRNRRTADNVFNVKYNFNNKMGLTFRLRHYWSKVFYTRLFNLKDDGYLEDVASVSGDPNNNVNFFNIDMNYTWQFAPGSFININWKSSSELFNYLVQDKYFRNLSNTVNEEQVNNFSVKVIYFLDYLSLKGKSKKS